MMSVFRYCLALLLVLCTTAGAADFAAQRRQFVSARQAYAAGDLAMYRRLSASLQNYPLYPYLRYDYLRDHLDSVSEPDLREFLAAWGDTLPGERLREAWLYRLARAQRWSDYLELYRANDDLSLRCYQLQGQLVTNRFQDADAPLDAIEPLWTVGHAQPGACDMVFHYYESSPRLTEARIWKRIGLAMEDGQLQLAGYLAQRLDAAGQRWVKRWQRMYERPSTQLEAPDYSVDSTRAREVLAFGVRRLARSAAETAWQRWTALKPRYRFTEEQSGAVARAIAIAAARQRSPHALEWLDHVPEKAADAELRQWRIRSAVLAGDWERVRRWTKDVPPAERNESWDYWRARALEEAGTTDGARLLYGKLAQSRSYYGFLATDRLERPYSLRNTPTACTDAELDRIGALSAVQRAHEFYLLGSVAEARREWRYATAKMPDRELQLAAVLAQRWGWYERAIMTAARGNHWDDLELRFPTPWRVHVLDNARRQQLDPAWIYGVLRQESAFMADARSSAGALGLMQLMPATADHTARLLERPPLRSSELLAPASNIQLGSAYLRHILDRFRGNQMLATAAYNAGPGRVRQWLPSVRSAPADQWVEAIPFSETRKYVQSVLSYSVIFDWRLQQPVKPLRERMGADVPALAALKNPTPY